MGHQPQPLWFPEIDSISTTNIAKLMKQKGFQQLQELRAWSFENPADFWETIVKELKIVFDKPYERVVDFSLGPENPKWFSGAKLNIVKSCFAEKIGAENTSNLAIISQSETGEIQKITYDALDKLSNRVVNSVKQKYQKGDKLGIVMPMTIFSVAIYLGLLKAGLVVVSIADSFSAEEIALRLKIAEAKAVFTQDFILRDKKQLPLYQRVVEGTAIPVLVLSAENHFVQNNDNKLNIKLRQQDMAWNDFLSNNENFELQSCEPGDPINILFSSGTTGTPKAIPWTETTPLKCAGDAFLHHNLKPGDIFCWPSNLGWMMGPWLIFACFLNRATIAIYEGAPIGSAFGKFIQDQKVTHLGVVPTLVKTWKNSGCMEGLNWSAIKLFTSTGECSNVEDMAYLMGLANNRPIIEYCGGTEVGGAYITGTVVEAAAPAAFTGPAFGLNFTIIDEEGRETDNGEVALISPSIGLSTELLNADHHKTYYADMPKSSGKILRRHGDQVERYANGFYRLHGRVDDTMNLSGIKVSSSEVERVLADLPFVFETAAIAIEPPSGGPSELVVYCVLKKEVASKESGSSKELKTHLQAAIKEHLNPLFKIQDVVIVESLPRTASNKVMRRVLRNEYNTRYNLHTSK